MSLPSVGMIEAGVIGSAASFPDHDFFSVAEEEYNTVEEALDEDELVCYPVSFEDEVQEAFATYENKTYAVLDTACASACAGDASLDGHLEHIPAYLHKDLAKGPDGKKYVGIEGKSISSDGRRRVPMGIQGHDIATSLAKFVKSKVPILFSWPQLYAMGAVIYAKEKMVDFRELGICGVPIEISAKGHPMISISDFI